MNIAHDRSTSVPLFDSILWRDPLSGRSMTPIVEVRTPSGTPLCGALKIDGTSSGYPIVDGVVRGTPALAEQHRHWLAKYMLTPPGGTPVPNRSGAAHAHRFQEAQSVSSFGFQWSWNSAMRSEQDLLWRVASRFHLPPTAFAGERVLDAGCGAGDQSRWLLSQHAAVVSIDLSEAIEVTARKLRDSPHWVGVQGDITALPFHDAFFDRVYCEGVIQHTQNSAQTVAELCRVTRPGGRIQATHYGLPASLQARLRHTWQQYLRTKLSTLDRFPLLFLCGVLACAAHIPLLGFFVRKSGTAIYSKGMPDFKSTWTNTYDNYGSHAFQRYISPEEFRGYFERVGHTRIVLQESTLIMAERT